MKKTLKGIMIRQANMKDIDILVGQRHKMFEAIRPRNWKSHKVADAAYRKWIYEMTRKKRFAGFLAVADTGEVVGGGCVWIREILPRPESRMKLKEPYLMSMYTEPSYRGKGIATGIVKEATKWSKQRGYKEMTLHASKYGRPVYSTIGWKRTWEMRIELTD